MKEYIKNDLGFVTTFNRYEYSLDNYIGEVLIELKKLRHAVAISFGKRKAKHLHAWMYYYGDRDNIPKRLKDMFGYE